VAVVFAHCDGRRRVADLAALATERLGDVGGAVLMGTIAVVQDGALSPTGSEPMIMYFTGRGYTYAMPRVGIMQGETGCRRPPRGRASSSIAPRLGIRGRVRAGGHVKSDRLGTISIDSRWQSSRWMLWIKVSWGVGAASFGSIDTISMVPTVRPAAAPTNVVKKDADPVWLSSTGLYAKTLTHDGHAMLKPPSLEPVPDQGLGQRWTPRPARQRVVNKLSISVLSDRRP
jgi:hypothetical protein